MSEIFYRNAMQQTRMIGEWQVRIWFTRLLDCGKASRYTTALISHTRPNPRNVHNNNDRQPEMALWAPKTRTLPFPVVRRCTAIAWDSFFDLQGVVENNKLAVRIKLVFIPRAAEGRRLKWPKHAVGHLSCYKCLKITLK